MFGLLKKKLAGFVEKISGGGKGGDEPPGQARKTEKVLEKKQLERTPEPKIEAVEKTDLKKEPPISQKKEVETGEKAKSSEKVGKKILEKTGEREGVFEKKEHPKQESIFDKITRTIAGEKKEAEGKVGKAEPSPRIGEKIELARAREEERRIEKICADDVKSETAEKEMHAQTKEKTAKKEKAEWEEKNLEEKTDIELAEFEVERMERLERAALSGKEREMKANVGIGKSVGSIFSQTITIEEKDIKQLLDELELSLLESDVAYEVSIEVCERLRKNLSGLKVRKNMLQEEIRGSIGQVLAEIMRPEGGFDFYEKVMGLKRPVKILLVGPNGAGKTTTIAKLAYGLKERGMGCVLAAGDTFRAAAIEQLQEHGRQLGVEVISGRYGADPASVAYDAIKHAHSNKADVVLIDSAGRQGTNANLIDEMKKINRVVSPDLRIYIGESIGGSALIEQIRSFHEAIGIDGAILTKVDCDAKGGTAISLSHSAKVPILFLGVGQKYEDLKKFDAKEVAKQIIG